MITDDDLIQDERGEARTLLLDDLERKLGQMEAPLEEEQIVDPVRLEACREIRAWLELRR